MNEALLKEQEVQQEEKRGSITLTVAQAIILYLSRQKVKMHDGRVESLCGGVFGIFGHGNVAGIGEALWRYRDEMPYIRGQSEQGMAHSAIAFAKANRARRVMAVTSSIGPGATNMVTAAATAHINRLPLLLLPGDIFVSRRPDPVLQQLESEVFPGDSVNDCFRPVSRYFDRIVAPEQLLHALPNAVRVMLDPVQRGPVTLSLPQDVQVKSYDFPLSFFDEKMHFIARIRPDRNEVARCASLLRRAKRPLIIAGGGVLYSGGEEALGNFAKRHRIPVAMTQAGKGVLPWDNVYNLGGVGVTGTSAANSVAKKADLILSVGTRLSDFTTASKSLFHRSDATIIGLNLSSFDASKGASTMLLCDVVEGLNELSKALEGYESEDAFVESITRVKREWELYHKKATTLPEDGRRLPSDVQVLGAVNRIIKEKDVVVCAAGGLPGELHKFWRSRDPLSYHLEYGYSCMGYEIAGAVGVKMALLEREVYVLVGDGSYLMLHTELLTALQQKKKINVVLLDNRGFGCINRLQQGCGSPRFGNLFEEDPSLKGVDFVANARSYGAYAKKARDVEELTEILEENKKRKESCVTVIETDPELSSEGFAWWDVAVAESSSEDNVLLKRQCYDEKLDEIKKGAF